MSVVYPEWIVYHQIVKSAVYNIHNASLIYPDWIFELAGNYYKDKRKDQANNAYSKQIQIERLNVVKKDNEERGLVEIGVAKKKNEKFNTDILGLKKMKKSQLSFQEEI